MKKKLNTHKKVIGNMNFPDAQEISNEDCEGELYYEEALEGNCCTKCEYYDGVK